MIHVGRQHGATSRYFLAHKLGCDVCLDAQLFAVHVLAYGHIFHFGSDNACLGVSHLGDAALAMGALLYPGAAHGWQSFVEVHLVVGVCVGATRVVDVDRSVGLHVGNTLFVAGNGRGEVHFGHSHANVGIYLSLHIRLFSLGVGFVVVWHVCCRLGVDAAVGEKPGNVFLPLSWLTVGTQPTRNESINVCIN